MACLSSPVFIAEDCFGSFINSKNKYQQLTVVAAVGTTMRTHFPSVLLNVRYSSLWTVAIPRVLRHFIR